MDLLKGIIITDSPILHLCIRLYTSSLQRFKIVRLCLHRLYMQVYILHTNIHAYKRIYMVQMLQCKCIELTLWSRRGKKLLYGYIYFSLYMSVVFLTVGRKCFIIWVRYLLVLDKCIVHSSFVILILFT